MWHKPFCALQHGAQDWVEFCIHICLNIDIDVECPCGNDDVVVCVDVLAYIFVKVYFDMSFESIKSIPSNMNGMYLEYSFLFLFIGSHCYSHVHKIAILSKFDLLVLS
jgi:hypothetical protein